MSVPYKSALEDEAIDHFSAEAKRKVASKQARLVLYVKIRGNIPKQTKVSLIAAIPYKSKAFRWILSLSFLLRLTPKGRFPSVNGKSENTALGGAIDEIGCVLLSLIRDFAESPYCAKFFR